MRKHNVRLDKKKQHNNKTNQRKPVGEHNNYAIPFLNKVS